MELSSSQNKIELSWIETGKVRPNPWNPNRMSEKTAAKLASDIKSRGMILPIVVRPVEDGFQIVDGEHRWVVANQLGMKLLPCIVVEMDEQEARIKTLQLNRLRGEDEPELLARLLRELNIEASIEKLSSRLPFDPLEIKQSLELLELRESEESRRKLEQEMKEALRDRIFSMIVSEEEKAQIEAAISVFQSRSGSDLKPGSALSKICEYFLSQESITK